MKITDEMVLAACRAHTPQFDRMDKEIVKYAISQMRASLTAAFLQCEQEPFCWVYEDELPKSMTKEAYNALYPHSKIDGVRLFPIYGPAAPTDVRAQTIRECAEDSGLVEENKILRDRLAALIRISNGNKPSKKYKCKDGTISIMGDVISNYIMARRPGASPFVLSIKELLNITPHHLGPFEPVTKEPS